MISTSELQAMVGQIYTQSYTQPSDEHIGVVRQINRGPLGASSQTLAGAATPIAAQRVETINALQSLANNIRKENHQITSNGQYQRSLKTDASELFKEHPNIGIRNNNDLFKDRKKQNKNTNFRLIIDIAIYIEQELLLKDYIIALTYYKNHSEKNPSNNKIISIAPIKEKNGKIIETTAHSSLIYQIESEKLKKIDFPSQLFYGSYNTSNEWFRILFKQTKIECHSKKIIFYDTEGQNLKKEVFGQSIIVSHHEKLSIHEKYLSLHIPRLSDYINTLKVEQ